MYIIKLYFFILYCINIIKYVISYYIILLSHIILLTILYHIISYYIILLHYIKYIMYIIYIIKTYIA